MNKSTTAKPPNRRPPGVGLSINLPLPINEAVRDAAWREGISANKWILAAINAKLGKTTEQ